MQVVDAGGRQRLEDDRRLGLAARPLVGEVVDLALRHAITHREIGADGAAHGLDRLDAQAQAVRQPAAVAVGALVGVVRQELVEQVAVRAVQFHAIEAGRLCPERRAGKGRHRIVHFRQRQRFRQPVGAFPTIEAHLHAFGLHR